MIITETWLKSQFDPVIAEFNSAISGYNFYHQSRSQRRGGGVAVLARSNLRLVEKRSKIFQSFELLDVTFKSASQLLRIIAVYRPPKSTKNMATISDFISEFSTLLETVVPSSGHLLVAGDFNFPFENTNSSDTSKLVDLLHSVGLKQHVKISTHSKGHTLDLLITRSSEQLLHSIRSDNSLNSDHSLLYFGLNVQRPPNTKVTISQRHFHTMNIDRLIDIISPKLISRPRNTNPDDLYLYFHQIVTDALDTVAPVKSKSVINKVRAPWFSEDLLTLRREVRRLEINWRKSQLEIDRQIFVLKRTEYSRRCDALKSAYHRTRIEDADNKKLFAIVAELSDSRTASSNAMPNNITMKEIPSAFMNYFENKVSQLRDRIGRQPHSCETGEHDVMPTHLLGNLTRCHLGI